MRETEPGPTTYLLLTLSKLLSLFFFFLLQEVAKCWTLSKGSGNSSPVPGLVCDSYDQPQGWRGENGGFPQPRRASLGRGGVQSKAVRWLSAGGERDCLAPGGPGGGEEKEQPGKQRTVERR